MSVYVGPETNCLPNKKWHWHTVTHLFADTLDELHSFAARIGLMHSWFQRGKRLPHYDLTTNKRALAIQRGAVELDRRAAIRRWRKVEGWKP